MSVADTLSRGSVPSTVRAAKDAESGSRRANATVGDPGAAEQAASVQARGADSGDILATSAGTGAIAALFTGRPTEPGSASPGTSGASLSTGVGGATGLVGPGGGGIPHSSPLEARLVAETHVATPMDQAGFVPAFSARIATLVRDGIEQARIRLNPLDMGPVAVQLALDGTQVRVDLAAEVAATRQLLEQSLPSLAGALREAGFTLSGGGVFQQSRQGLGGEPQASSSSDRAVSATDDHADAATDSMAARGGSWGRAGRGLIDVFA